ncbi:MAG: hypothetical protein ACFFDN_17225 [Candidatus Hodarchaeota archaeon]
MTSLIEGLEKKLENFKYISTKSEILIHIAKYYFSRKDFEKIDEFIEKFFLAIDKESNVFVRSKLLHKSIKILLTPSNVDDFYKIEKIIDILLKKIESPYYKLDSWLEKLKFLSYYGDKKTILKEIREIDDNLQKFLKLNFIFSIENIFNPLKNKLHQYFLDQNSLDILIKKFLTISSEIADRLKNEDLFQFALKRIELIKLKLYQDETIRNIVNNYYLMAIKKGNRTLTLRIYEISKKIRNKSFWAETLYNYSNNLLINESFQEIKQLIDLLISIINNTKGEYSRAIILKETLKILQNLKQEPIRDKYFKKIKELNDKFQGQFSSLLVKIRLIEVLYNLNRYNEAKKLFKEVIKYSNLINEQHLFLIIFQQLINLIPGLINTVDSDLISYFIIKLNETRDPVQKSKSLLMLAEKIENFQTQVKEIRQIIEDVCDPYVSNNILFINHMYPILNFSIKQAFKINEKEIIKNPLKLVEKAYSYKEKCLLILQFMNQFKKRNQTKLVQEYQIMFMRLIDKISNEFEKKEVIIKLLNFTK